MWTMKLKGGLGSLDLNPPDDGRDFMSDYSTCIHCQKRTHYNDMHDDEMCVDCFDEATEVECIECGTHFKSATILTEEKDWVCAECASLTNLSGKERD